MDGLSWPCKQVRYVAFYLVCLGEPTRSDVAWVYRLGIVGLVKKLQMEGIPQDCLGPIVPDDIAAPRICNFYWERIVSLSVNKTLPMRQVDIRSSLWWSLHNQLPSGGRQTVLFFFYGQYAKPHRGRSRAGGLGSETGDG